MCLLFETIRCCDGQLENIAWHNDRFNRTRRDLFGSQDELDLDEIVQIPPSCAGGLFKCRVTYGRHMHQVEFEPYAEKKVRSLKIVHADDIEYEYKYRDRKTLDKLFAARRNCDDILIVRKGKVTDTSYANIVFFDGTRWLTPAVPLLRGTRRAPLLASSRIEAVEIAVGQFDHFQQFMLINAMLEFEPGRAIGMEHIVGDK